MIKVTRKNGNTAVYPYRIDLAIDVSDAVKIEKQVKDLTLEECYKLNKRGEIGYDYRFHQFYYYELIVDRTYYVDVTALYKEEE